MSLGAIGIVRPDVLWRYSEDRDERRDTPNAAERRRMRVSALLLLLLSAAVLYAAVFHGHERPDGPLS